MRIAPLMGYLPPCNGSLLIKLREETDAMAALPCLQVPRGERQIYLEARSPSCIQKCDCSITITIIFAYSAGRSNLVEKGNALHLK